MLERKISNGKILSVMLGYEDPGCLTCMIYIEFDNAVQGFGGYALDIYDESKKSRVGTAYGMEWIISLMKVLDVKKFEDIKDQYIRIDSSHRKIYRIGHIVKDQWFDPEKMYNEKN